jgi:hypothetical protein
LELRFPAIFPPTLKLTASAYELISSVLNTVSTSVTHDWLNVDG